jgi:hypothetical protein
MSWSWPAGAERALRWSLFLLALAILGYRFLNPDLFPFMLDEPQLLDAARTQIKTGHWATASPLLGNQGIHYGAAAVWVYGVVHLLAGPNPEAHIYAMAGLVILTSIALAVTIGRVYGERTVLPATVLALIASSPYQFHWSRMAWDQLVEICAGLGVALLCMRADLSWRRAAAVGIVLGLGASTHPMIGPTVGILFGFAVLRSQPRRRLASALVVAGSAAIVSTPYIYYLASNPTRANRVIGMPWYKVPAFLHGPFRVASVIDISHYIDWDWSTFAQASPRWATVITDGEKALPYVDCVVGVVLIATMLCAKTTLRRRVAALAGSVWIAQALLYANRRTENYANYQWPTWWIAMVAVAAGLHLLRGRLGWLRPVGISLVWAVALAQTAFLVRWVRFERQNGGARGICFGTVISEQRRLVRAACRSAGSEVWLKTEASIFPEALRYVASVEPACAGKQLLINDDRANTDPRVRVRRVVYSPPNTAHLALE